MARRKRIRKIRSLVDQLLEQANIQNPPVDIEKIATMLEITIKRSDLDDISGVLYNEGGQAIIGVNESHAKVRERFTIAHEIGHFLLHAHESLHIDKMFPQSVRLRDQASSEGSYIDEMEANAFAAELLMPRTLLLEDDLLQRKAIDYHQDDVIEELAKKFKVSTQAMTFRLINLGFIEG